MEFTTNNSKLNNSSGNTTASSTASFAESSRSLDRVSRTRRIPQYPAVSVSASPSSASGTSASTVRYAVPYRPSVHSSSSNSNQTRFTEKDMQVSNLCHRVRMLEEENERLNARQGQIVADADRRVQMHLNEIRMLKEETKKLHTENKELRDLCCFLDDDRRKIRQLGKEWHKFGRYTSHLMKQESQSYQSKLREFDIRQEQLVKENEELRQLCLYLDEQRQILMHKEEEDRQSEDLGCAGSERSSDSSDRLKPESEQLGLNQLKELAIRRISDSVHNPASLSQTITSIHSNGTGESNNRILNYIQSLESRIKQLERSQNQQDDLWPSSADINSENEEKTVIEKWRGEVAEKKINATERLAMIQSTTSTMTSSGTTYGSWDTDNESAVFVMGGEDGEEVQSLEVRQLPVITEEEASESNTKSCEDVRESGKLPPKMAPISLSTLSVSRLSLCNHELISPRSREQRSQSQGLINGDKDQRSTMSDAVHVLRLHELAKGLPTPERNIIRPLCQAAWDSIDRRSLTLSDSDSEQNSQV